ncbi:hypothetical protein TNIN_337421 [Trichonephila inaurata madagascariensis]|uniref:Uncharacterized protein n=1 Tax=Trichonephila inaurata madagascariensis TaxID=2747483 RepID=A0A8X6XJH1_9ARAC|nr:hypothetical protein TNIN_337421 [Trichonephila inaurata madagascariensis]
MYNRLKDHRGFRRLHFQRIDSLRPCYVPRACFFEFHSSDFAVLSRNQLNDLSQSNGSVFDVITNEDNFSQPVLIMDLLFYLN